jgi:acetyl-CoA carboxylase carboxyltransferase component
MGIVKEKIKDLKTRESRILGMGGEKLVAKHKEKGKLTARERIGKLFDKGTFREIDMFVGIAALISAWKRSRFLPTV